MIQTFNVSQSYYHDEIMPCKAIQFVIHNIVKSSPDLVQKVIQQRQNEGILIDEYRTAINLLGFL
jgi:hypothetical protein